MSVEIPGGWWMGMWARKVDFLETASDTCCQGSEMIQSTYLKYCQFVIAFYARF